MSGLQGNAAETAWIRSRIDTLWRVGGSYRTPIAWDNVAFSPTPGTPYIRPLIRRSGGEQASLGPNGLQRYDGMLVVEVRTPAGTGTAQNDALCDEMEKLFRLVGGSGIRFWTPWTVTVGNVDGWYKQDVLCPYERDTIYT